MAQRLTKIYTRSGDKGTTGLGDGSRVEKDCLRIECLGTTDELNCVIGKLLTHPLPNETQLLLTTIQHHLFDLGGELCLPGHTLFPNDRSAWLEEHLDALNADLQPLEEFILPGGTPAAAECHFARSVCRRAERLLCALHRQEPLNASLLSYLNRLSDLLFVLARYLNKVSNHGDALWMRKK